MKPFPLLIALIPAALLTGCATADFTPYTGAQQKWPTAPGAFVQTVEAGHGPMAEGGAYKLPVYFGPPNRPYQVIGSIDAEVPLGVFQSGKIESLRPAVRQAAQHGADAIIVMAQDVETRGYSTMSFANANANTNYNAVAYGNGVYGHANTTANTWGSAFSMPNRQGKARVLAIKFI
jgi:hypothetical protein